MKKRVFIFINVLFLSHFAGAQKLIYISDSTTLKQYAGRTQQVISVSQDKKVTTGTQITIDKPAEGSGGVLSGNKPAQENDGIPGGPQIRITRNDNGIILRKELNSVTRVMDWSSVKNEVSFLHYRTFVSSEGKIDSLAYYITYMDTAARTGRGFMMRDKLGKIEQEDFRTSLEAGLMKILQNYTPLSTVTFSREQLQGGAISLRSKVRDLDEFLASQPDTITSINLTDFGLREFPYQLKRFPNLKNINLKDNYIGSATLDKKDFPKLVTVSFQNNLLRDDSLIFTGGLRPSAINLTDNHLTRIPKTHRKVKYLYLANSSISEVTKKDLRKIKKVEFLNLYANTLTEITPKITRLKKLKELDLYRNRLSSLPTTITRMKKLETLAVSYNTLEELPANIRSMSSLKTLYSHHNKLKTLPPLPETLEVLDVGYNSIEEVSARIQPLKKLKTLDYSYNRVKGDLDFLLGLPQIKEIYLMENRYAASEEEEKYFSTVFSTLVSKGVTVK